jgi:hypothetical protein
MLEDYPDGELNKRRVYLREMGNAERRKEGTTTRKDSVSRGDKTYHIKSYEMD